MRVACVGGGPGGLFLAALLRRDLPAADVVVFERNRADSTFGFGVVFSDAAAGAITAADPELSARLAAASRHWDDIEVRVSGARERIGGMGMSAIVRTTLLDLLRDRAEEAGARLCFETEVRDARQLADFDLVVVCDGANSRFRRAFAADFGPSAHVAGTKFIWFGAARPFDCLTFVHEGAFAAHAYPISDEMSTFIVETDPATWAAAGLDGFDPATPPGPSDETAKAFLEDLFGCPLVGNNSRWGNFTTLRTRTWRRGNWVLLGDAAHTAHFSVGSGTRMAMEDAVALAAELVGSPHDLPAALLAYERRRRPEVEKVQRSARPSLSWWERFGTYADAFEPTQFGFHFLSRSITRERLRSRDGGYVDRVDRWWRDRHGAPPARTPLRCGGLVFPGRHVEVSGDALVLPDGTAVALAPFDGRAPGRGVWIDAPAVEADLPVAAGQVRAAAGEGVPLVGVRGGTPLTRVLVAEEARLAHSLPVVVAGEYDEDAATTLLLSGRADLVGVPPRTGGPDRA
ncbi:FAD-dependent monooxygenase [Saccharothrix sp. HUAS TT1]|uniref:FAD-dependent monooxygenase n=1 Tax=unclassified Saccharothrix TaxID=2593673 RepID=UPI00345B91DF